MEYTFRNWLACPECNEREDLSTLAHHTDIVLECYECGQISEFVIGKDISLQDLDIDAIATVAEERTSD